jgi:hypothetical protein
MKNEWLRICRYCGKRIALIEPAMSKKSFGDSGWRHVTADNSYYRYCRDFDRKAQEAEPTLEGLLWVKDGT